MFIRCPFCHRRVFFLFYSWHESKHTKLLPDGQMTDHITLPPTAQFQGSLAGVPRAYLHERCGAVTGMPEEIIRSYLGDPFLYSGGSFCCGCGDYMPYAELFWHETGQCLADYFRQLQEDFIIRNDLNSPITRGHYIAVAMQQRDPRFDGSKEIVVLTPAAAKRIRELVKQLGGDFRTSYLRVTMRAPIVTLGLGNIIIDIDGAVDPIRDQTCRSQGINTVVLKDYAELLRGIQVDFKTIEHQTGFAIQTPFAN